MSALPIDDEALARAVTDALPEAVVVYLFGSHAEGTPVSSSDVDLAVLTRTAIAPARVAASRGAISERLRRDVDLIDLAAASTVLRARVVSTSRVLYDADPSLREFFESTTYSAYARLNEERREILAQIRAEGRVHGR